MKTAALLFLVLSLSAALGLAQSISPPDTYMTRTAVGQPMPAFTVTDMAGRKISLADLRGKVALVNFWATWCGPCRAEMPRLEKEIWQNYKSKNFVMIAIAREQSKQEIAAFLKQNPYTFPMAPDPKRDLYKHFADAGIPRNYVVRPDGTILFQSLGYNPAEFDQMKSIIGNELAKLDRTAH